MADAGNDEGIEFARLRKAVQYSRECSSGRRRALCRHGLSAQAR
jgi:hypothetical protein